MTAQKQPEPEHGCESVKAKGQLKANHRVQKVEEKKMMGSSRVRKGFKCPLVYDDASSFMKQRDFLKVYFI